MESPDAAPKPGAGEADGAFAWLSAALEAGTARTPPEAPVRPILLPPGPDTAARDGGGHEQVQAQALAQSVMRESRVAEALLGIFDQLGLGVCLVDAGMRAALVSGRAQRSGVVRLRRDLVVTAQREDDVALRAAVAAALASPDAPVQGLRLGPRERPHHALVTALRPPFAEAGRIAAVILLPQDRPEHGARVIQCLFGLSPVEARITKLLADGLTPNEAAAQMRMRLNTLRGYMKSIFVKLDVHRQSDLVRLISGTAGLLRGAAEPQPPGLDALPPP